VYGGCYNFVTGVDLMKLNEIVKNFLESEEFAVYAPILKEENWKKATPNKRLKFLNAINDKVREYIEELPDKVRMRELDPDSLQTFVFLEDMVVVDEDALNKTFNPYNILCQYFFEIAFVYYIDKTNEDEFVKTEKGRKMDVNTLESMTGEWDNLLPRYSEEFLYQPLTFEAWNVAHKITYSLMQHMHKTYGMDKYIGDTLTSLMLSSFDEQKRIERVEKNFKVMEENSRKCVEEQEKLEAYFDYMNDLDFDSISDEEFYSFFNSKILNISDEDTLQFLFMKFIERELKDCEGVEEILDNFAIGEHEEYGKYLYIKGRAIIVNTFQDAFFNVVLFVSNAKLAENKCPEFKDKKAIDDARLCYGYLIELQDEGGAVEVKYLENALSYYDYRSFMVNHYYEKIKKAIKNNKYYNEGRPYLNRVIDSRYEAYLDFAYGKTFEEVRQEQFVDLQEQYYKKVGGKR